MSNHSIPTDSETPDLNQILSLLDGQVIVVNVHLAKLLGLHEAIFLSYLIFWCGKSDDGWGFRTQEQVQDDTCLTRRDHDTCRAHLRDLGILEEERKGSPARLFYRVNAEAIFRVFSLAHPPNLIGSSAKLDCTDPPIKIVRIRQSNKEDSSKSISTSSNEHREREQIEQNVKTVQTRKRRLPDDWAPPDEAITWAVDTTGLAPADVARETEKFRDHFIANGKPQINWLAAWRNWIRRSLEFQPAFSSSPNGRSPTSVRTGGAARGGMTTEELRAWSEELEREGK